MARTASATAALSFGASALNTADAGGEAGVENDIQLKRNGRSISICSRYVYRSIFNVVGLTAIAVLFLCSSTVLAQERDAQQELDRRLVELVRNGTVEDIKQTLAAGANPNGDVETSMFRRRKTRPETERRSPMPKPLFYAVKRNRIDVMKLLIDAGADVNQAESGGDSSIRRAAGVPDAAALKMLLTAGAKPTPSALAAACSQNRTEAIDILLKAGVAPDHGLPWAVGNIDLVKRLLRLGADPNAKSLKGQAALHMCSNTAVIKLLLDAGADPNVRDEGGKTPLHQVRTAEHAALLVDAGANINLRDFELVSPIRYAAWRKPAVYEFLLKKSGGKEQPGKNPASLDLDSDKTTAELIGDLKSQDYKIRKRAELLAVARGEDILPELIELFDTPDEAAQLGNSSIGFLPRLPDVLGKIGPQAESALPTAESLLADHRTVVMGRLIMDRIKPGHFQSRPQATIDKFDDAVYQLAIDPTVPLEQKWFAHWISPTSTIQLLKSKEQDNRWLGLKAARRWSAEDIQKHRTELETLLIVLQNDKTASKRTRERATSLFGAMTPLSDRVVEALMQHLRDPDIANAVGGVLGKGDPALIPEFVKMLSQPESVAAHAALRSFGTKAIPHLEPLLSAEDDKVARMATQLLHSSGEPAHQVFMKAIHSKDAKRRERGLGHAPLRAQPDFRAEMLRILESTDEPIRLRIIAASRLAVEQTNDQTIEEKDKRRIHEAIAGIREQVDAAYARNDGLSRWAGHVIRYLRIPRS